jgi:hypothetical protein
MAFFTFWSYFELFFGSVHHCGSGKVSKDAEVQEFSATGFFFFGMPWFEEVRGKLLAKCPS